MVGKITIAAVNRSLGSIRRGRLARGRNKLGSSGKARAEPVDGGDGLAAGVASARAIRLLPAPAFYRCRSAGMTGVPSQPCCRMVPCADPNDPCTSNSSCNKCPSEDVRAVALDAGLSLSAG
jgi:hypothetical protein